MQSFVRIPSGIIFCSLSLSLSLQVGDGTNFVLVFSGALLEHAEELLRMGLSPSEVVEGYKMACNKALEILPCKCLKDCGILTTEHQVTEHAKQSVFNQKRKLRLLNFFSLALVCRTVTNLQSKEEVKKAITPVIATMQVLDLSPLFMAV